MQIIDDSGGRPGDKLDLTQPLKIERNTFPTLNKILMVSNPICKFFFNKTALSTFIIIHLFSID